MTINIEELRRLAQEATPGPWKAGRYLGSPRQLVIHTDVGDKCRESDVTFTSAAFGNDETVANARFIAAVNPAAINELLDRLEAAEKERDEFKRACFGHISDNSLLRAKIAEMEKQEPVTAQQRFQRQQEMMAVWLPWQTTELRKGRPARTVDVLGLDVEYRELYALPGAQPAPSIPDVCTWREDESVWHSACGGAMWQFTDEGPIENGMKFCLACGKPMAVATPEAKP